MITLTEDQIFAKRRIIAFIKGKGIDEAYFTLSGKGGTGKTFVIGKALDEIIKDRTNSINYNNVICATVSHSAKNVLAASVDHRFQVMTIAALLNMKLTFSDTGELLFKPPVNFKYAPIAQSSVRIVVIDECSMVSSDLFNLIMSAKRQRVKVIAMGDHCQLPPVGEADGSPFLQHIGSDLSLNIFGEDEEDADQVHRYSELTEIMRYKGPVVQLGEQIREQIELCMDDKPYDKFIMNRATGRNDILEDGSGVKFYNNPFQFIDAAVHDFSQNPTDPLYCVIIAYTNKSVNKFNEVIRRKLYGDNLPKFVNGELVINEGGYAFFNKNTNHIITSIHNGEILKVEHVHHEPKGPENIPSLVLTFYGKTYPSPVYVVDPIRGLKMYTKRLNELKKNALRNSKQWKEFYAFKTQFAEFKYSYSVTSHKVQGKTLTNAYIYEEEIMHHSRLTAQEKFQSLYVALTRPRKIAHIYNKKFKVNTNSYESSFG